MVSKLKAATPNPSNIPVLIKSKAFVRLLLVVPFLLLPMSACAQEQDQSGFPIANPLAGQLNPYSQSNSSTPYSGDTNTDSQSDSQDYFNRGLQSGQSSSSVLRGGDLQGTQDAGAAARRNQLLRDEFVQQQILRLLPPDPPTEFQKMVASSTGKMLPIYGAKLFLNSPSTFSPLDRVPVTPDYVIGPGDELLIQIWGQVTLNSHFFVDRSGNIYIPQVGTIRVAGLSFGQVRDFLMNQVGKVFRHFDLNVNMGELRSIQVFVVGQARRPGSYTVSSLSTLADALFVTGGPTPQGSMRHIQLKRAGVVVAEFDLYDLLRKGDKSKDAQLLPGDVIFIPPVGPQVAVAGTINTPAIYELKSSTASTVDEVLDLAAGPSTVASNQTAHLERIDDHRMRSVTDLSLNAESRATILRDGDILELVSIVDRFKDGVTLRGNVANPGHYGWRPGMRVGELFPDKDALITRDYWLKRGQLGQPVLTYVPVCPPGFGRNQNSQMYGVNGNTADNTNGGNGNSGNGSNGSNGSNYSTYNSSNGSYGSGNPNGNEPYSESDLNRTEDDSHGCIVLPDSARNNGDTQSLNGMSGGNQQNQNRQQQNNQQQPPDPMQRASQATGQLSTATAMIGRGSSQFQPRNDVKLSEPDIDWSYAVIERQNKETLQTSLSSFNLGRLVLDKDESQDLELMPGDVVTIFSKADIRVPQSQQTRFVHLEGEFLSSGIYSVQPGETLKELVKRAGGVTTDAYLYGSEFTRESTRRVQQQRLNEYVDQIALQTSTNSANSASRSVSALDTAAATTMAAQSQSVINSLRQMRATGRIVLDLKAGTESLDQLPPIPLEDGDRFVVPQVPSTVNVTGAVFNPNSFIFDEHRRLRDYLKLAGGGNRDADKKSTYVIRADGSVISRRQISSFKKDTFDQLRIHPGDTVVVPLNLTRGASLRNIVDIAQIVGQFGVAIAAADLVF